MRLRVIGPVSVLLSVMCAGVRYPHGLTEYAFRRVTLHAPVSMFVEQDEQDRQSREDPAVEFLARESHVPIGDVAQLYGSELAKLRRVRASRTFFRSLPSGARGRCCVDALPESWHWCRQGEPEIAQWLHADSSSARADRQARAVRVRRLSPRRRSAHPSPGPGSHDCVAPILPRLLQWPSDR